MGGMLPTRDVMISFYVPPEKRGTAYGIVGSSMMLGNVVGPMIGGKVAAVAGLNAVYLVTGFIFLAALYWIWFYLKEVYRSEVKAVSY